MIELSLAVGKAPVIEFTPLAEIVQNENEKISSLAKPPIDKVAEPGNNY